MPTNAIVKLFFVVSILILPFQDLSSQSVGINTSSPDSSAVLDIRSSEKGVLLPFLDSLQRVNIENPANGLMVFDTTTHSFWYMEDTVWVQIGKRGPFERVEEEGAIEMIGDFTDDFLLGFSSIEPGSVKGVFFDASEASFNIGQGSISTWKNNAANTFTAGFNNEALGHSSSAIGHSNKSDGFFASTIGRENTSDGISCIAIGEDNLADGNNSMALGESNESQGSNSITLGSSNVSEGSHSIAIGDSSHTIGDYSLTFGNRLRSESYSSIVLGSYNAYDVSNSDNSWVPTDPLLIVGNGTDNGNRSNALTILKNGTVSFQEYTFPNSDGTEDQFMTTDGSGQLSWATSINKLADGDDDTRIELEEVANENIIRFYTEGVERAYMDAKTFHLIGPGESTYVGHNAGQNAGVSISQNVGFGKNALTNMSTGAANTGIGTNAMGSNIDGSNNTAVGHNAFISHEGGTSNSIFGSVAASNMELGNYNVIFGAEAGNSRKQLSSNVFIGYKSGMATSLDLFSRTNNVFIGQSAGFGAQGSGNIFLGSEAGRNLSGSNLLIIENEETTYDNAFISGDLDNDELNINADVEVSKNLEVGPDPNPSSNLLQVRTAGSEDLFHLTTGNSTRMRVYNNGSISFGTAINTLPEEIIYFDREVGFGIQSPVREITVKGTISAANSQLQLNRMDMTHDGTNAILDAIGGGRLNFRHDGSTQMTLSDDGWLGVSTGNTSPSFPLEVGTSATDGNGAHVTQGGTWTNGSSRTFKEKFESVDGYEILEKLSNLDILKWNYINSTEGPHLGPIAEDFHEAFGLGGNEKYISTVDIDGVALVGIQVLHEENTNLKERVEILAKENKLLKEDFEALKNEVTSLMKRLELKNSSK